MPGYYITVTLPPPNANTIPLGWTPVIVSANPFSGDFTSQYVLVRNQSATPPGPVQAQQWIPPVPAVPAVPPTGTIYPPPDWDAGAASLADLVVDGDFVCNVNAGVSGVCIGFASTLSFDPKNIKFGLYCHNGVAQSFENVPGLPTATGSSATYMASDQWKLRRRQGVCTLHKNGALVATCSFPIYGSMKIQASLYAGYDGVRDAAITPYGAGSVNGGFQPLTGTLGTSTKNRGVKGTFRPFTGVISDRARGSVNGSFMKMAGSIGRLGNHVNGAFRYMTGHISAGGFTSAPPQGVDGGFLPFQGVSHGLTGQIGGVAGSFRLMTGLTGRALQGEVNGGFQRMYGQSSASPPGVAYLDSYALASDSWPVEMVLVVSIDSTGTASDAWLVSVELNPLIDSFGVASDAWVVSQIDTLNITSTAFAHDLMALGVVVSDPTHPLPAADGKAVWVLNLDTNANTRYENFGYTSFGTHQGRLFGTKDDGVYLLEGDDDNGADILASFALGTTNFADPKDTKMAGALKRLVAVYLGVASDKTMYLKIVSGGEEFLYISRTNNANLMQQRVDPGRGLRSTYYGFEVYNSEGSDFDLESIEFVPVKLSRRI